MTAREARVPLNEILPPRSSEGGTQDTNDTKQDRNIGDGGTVDTSDTESGRDTDGGTVDTTDTKTDGKGLGGEK